MKNGTIFTKYIDANVAIKKENYIEEKHPHFSRFFRFFRFPENHAIFREKFREKHARAKKR